MVLIFVRSFGFFFDTAYLTKGLYLYSDDKNDMVKDIIGENYAQIELTIASKQTNPELIRQDIPSKQMSDILL